MWYQSSSYQQYKIKMHNFSRFCPKLDKTYANMPLLPEFDQHFHINPCKSIQRIVSITQNTLQRLNYVVMNCGVKQIFTIFVFRIFRAGLKSCLDDAQEPLSMAPPPTLERISIRGSQASYACIT